MTNNNSRTYLDLRLAAIQAYDCVKHGRQIKGVLVKEDIFYNFHKSHPDFKGVLGVTDDDGRIEFYFQPIDNVQQLRLGIDNMGRYGVVFTPLEKCELEAKLK